jgi:acetyl-CoA carboxylase carboxyl transferase subunit alpha
LKLTAQDLSRLQLIDAVVPEPVGGAQRDPAAAMRAVADKVWSSLEPLLAQDAVTLRARRREKFLEMGKHGIA